MKSAGRLVWILSAIVAVVAAIAMRDAVASYGRPIAGVLLDVGGSVSSLGLPDWEGKRLGLRYPEGLVARGVPEAHGSRARAKAWDQAVARAASVGWIDAIVESPSGHRAVRLGVHPLEPLAWWVYGGSGLIGGLLYVGVGLLALWVSPRSRLARTFAMFGVNTGLFLLCLFDIHTERSLVYIFFANFALLPVTLVMLVLRLPSDAGLLRKYPWLELLGYALALVFAVATSIVYDRGGDTRNFQTILTAAVGLGFLAFVIGFAVRYVRAPEEGREILRPLLVSMVPPYAVFGVTVFLVLALGQFGVLKSVADLVAYPTMIFAPLASSYAFVRHDLWGSRALLSRIATHVVLGALACMVAIAVGAALAASMGLAFRDALVGAALSAFLVLSLTAIGRAVSDSTLFRSRAEYKPTIEQLSLELLTITSQAEVARAVERTVRRWLPCDFVRLTLDESADVTNSSAPAGLEPPRDSRGELRLPVAFSGRPLAWLDVGPKRGAALFTKDDVDLLRTTANQGALALAHAQAYQELEDRRRQQAQAWRGEREALVETVAAEIAHEIRYPINYFRSVFERSASGEVLDREDVDVGREEVDRLERLVSGLRRMAAHRLDRVPISILELCARAEALLGDVLLGRRIELNVGAEALVRCDSDKIMQVLINLLSNALEASGEEGKVAVSFDRTEQAAELVVWDDGPGFLGDPAKLFAPWFTTKPRGTGLGLAITQRLVRAHGWNITAQRRQERTAFVITMRREDILQSELELSTPADSAVMVKAEVA